MARFFSGSLPCSSSCAQSRRRSCTLGSCPTHPSVRRAEVRPFMLNRAHSSGSSRSCAPAGARPAAGKACCTRSGPLPFSPVRAQTPRATRASCHSSRRSHRSRRDRSARTPLPARQIRRRRKSAPIATRPCSTRNSWSVSVSARSICARVIPARSKAAFFTTRVGAPKESGSGMGEG